MLECIRFDLVSLKSDKPGCLPRKEAEDLLQQAVRCGDTLQGEWLWDRAQLIVTNPPWLRIKDRFRGMEEGKKLRRELGEQLRALNDNGVQRFSTMRGNVNLYRLFIERDYKFSKKEAVFASLHPTASLENNRLTRCDNFWSKNMDGAIYGH